MGLPTLDRLNIGPRLIFGFALIILSMLAADAVVLWQFHVVRTQAGRLNDMDQALVSVFRVHSSLMAFSDRLDALADSEDAGRLVTEMGPLRADVLAHIRRATSALSLPPFDLQRDPTVLPTFHVIESALPSQLEGITTLANAGDWRAVRLRVENQVQPLESLASALVEKVAQQARAQQSQIALDIRRVQRLVFLVVPLTAVFTVLIAVTLGLAVTRSITRPLARLVEGSKALARGEFQHQVSVSGNDELAHLGHVFNDSARRLHDLYRAEEALREAQSELAHVSRVTTLGEVTASLAHEVNQPLAAIVNNANACLGLLPDRRDLDEVRESLADIVSDGDRASAIIERVRGLAKRSTAPKVPLRLADVVADVVALASSESATRSVVIRTEVGADLPLVLGDRVQLQQVVLNLVVNGMDAMRAVAEGERVLEIRARPDSEEGAPAAVVTVQDWGVGLEPGQADRVFEAFYTTKPQGMGMGLAISRSIIEAHAGRLWARSNNPERGATFSFRLPAVPAASSS
jgi:C4-dicarboxylate-specific signal transduction histidine kinase